MDHLIDAPPDTTWAQHAGITGDARVGCVDSAGFRAGMPLVDRVIILHTRVGAAPGGEGDFLPERAGFDGLGHLAVGAVDQLPVTILLDGFEEFIGDADRVIGVLATDRGVGFPVEIVVELQVQLLCQILLILRKALQSLGHRGHFEFFAHFPVDEIFHVRVIQIQAAHLGRTAGGPTRLDRARRPIPNLQKAHQPRRFPATAQGFLCAAHPGKIGTGPRTILEQACLAGPQIHQTTGVYQVVADGLDETIVDDDVIG